MVQLSDVDEILQEANLAGPNFWLISIDKQYQNKAYTVPGHGRTTDKVIAQACEKWGWTCLSRKVDEEVLKSELKTENTTRYGGSSKRKSDTIDTEKLDTTKNREL
jgi:uncharacterized protein (DUF2132 family)